MKTFHAFRFSRSVFLRFNLYLLKESILRALKRDFERAYLMIVGQSWCFTSCYRRFNLCTAIFYRRVRSVNSEEWLQTFYAFKFCSPTVFNFDLHKIEKGILQGLWRDLWMKCICKSSMLGPSHKHVPDHDRNLQKSDLRK